MKPAVADEFCEAVWRELLPPEVCFSAGFEPQAVDLTVHEQACLVGAGERRRREFAAGRWHARRALRELGLQDASIPRGSDGAPVWPDGFTGTISHTVAGGRVFAVAAVARFRDELAVGIDVEAPGSLPARVWETALMEAEMARVMTLPAPLRGAEVTAYWCAKEAVAKAWRGRLGVGSIGIFREPGLPDFEARSQTDHEVRDAARIATGKIVQHAGWTFASALRDDSVPVAAAHLVAACGQYR